VRVVRSARGVCRALIVSNVLICGFARSVRIVEIPPDVYSVSIVPSVKIVCRAIIV
jgi:hypothetical protein